MKRKLISTFAVHIYIFEWHAPNDTFINVFSIAFDINLETAVFHLETLLSDNKN